MSVPILTKNDLTTPRLILEVLTVEHAEEMVSVLADPKIYAYIDDKQPSLSVLQQRYRRQIANWSGYPVSWHNWVIRNRLSGDALGYVQASIDYHTRTAELAWVLAPKHWGNGYAREAVRKVMTEITNLAIIDSFVCLIDAHNTLSKNLASALGFSLADPQPISDQKWEMQISAWKKTTSAQDS